MNAENMVNLCVTIHRNHDSQKKCDSLESLHSPCRKVTKDSIIVGKVWSKNFKKFSFFFFLHDMKVERGSLLAAKQKHFLLR